MYAITVGVVIFLGGTVKTVPYGTYDDYEVRFLSLRTADEAI